MEQLVAMERLGCPPGTVCMPADVCEESGGECVATAPTCEKPNCCCSYVEEVIEEFEDKQERGVYTREESDNPGYLEGFYEMVKRDPQKAAFVWFAYFMGYARQLGIEERYRHCFAWWRTTAMLLYVGEVEAARELVRIWGGCLLAGWLLDRLHSMFPALVSRLFEEVWDDVRRSVRYYIADPVRPHILDEIYGTIADMWGSDPEAVAKALMSRLPEWHITVSNLYFAVYITARYLPDPWLEEVVRALRRLRR